MRGLDNLLKRDARIRYGWEALWQSLNQYGPNHISAGGQRLNNRTIRTR
jgi:hypothetical protein